MKKKVIGFLILLAVFLPSIVLFSACSCSKKDYNITFENFDNTKLSMGFVTGDSTYKVSELFNKVSSLGGYDVYDYSEFEVLVNGEPNTELFNKYSYSNEYAIVGNNIQLGHFNFNNVKSDITISFTGIKERVVEIGFMASNDERLADKKIQEEQPTYSSMLTTFGNNFKVKISDSDYNYIKLHDRTISRDSNGYVSAKYLFTDNTSDILYYVEDEEEIVDGKPALKEVYSPYFFKYNAIDFFTPRFKKVYAYIGEDFQGTFDSKNPELANKYKEYVYDECYYNDNNRFGFPMLTNQSFGYYEGINGTNYDFVRATDETQSVVTISGKGIFSLTDMFNVPLSNYVVENLKNYVNFTFNLYDKNFIVLDFNDMKIAEISANIQNVNAYISNDLSGSYGSPFELTKVNTQREFKIVNLCEVDGVSGINFENAKIYVNGTELTGKYGSYVYVPENTDSGINDYFNCVINAGVMPIDFYSIEDLQNDELFFDTTNYNITIENIDFSNATGLSTIKLNNLEYTYFYPGFENTILYQWENLDGSIEAYTSQKNEFGDNNIVNIYFNVATCNKLTIKNGDMQKTYDLIDCAKRVLNGTIDGTYDDSNGIDSYVIWKDGIFEFSLRFVFDNGEQNIDISNLADFNLYINIINSNMDIEIWGE